MAKKQKSYTWLAILIVGIILLYGGSAGWFKGLSTFSSTTFNNQLNPENFEATSVENYWIKLEVIPPRICVGDSITGIITSNMPNANCRIFFNPNSMGWDKLADVRLDSSGSYSQSGTISVAGYADLATICCDSNFQCALSNQVRLVSEVCSDSDSDSDSDSPSSYTCGVTSYCYAGTCPTGYTCEQIESSTAVWCACISGNEVHPWWKPGGSNYNPEEIQQEPEQEQFPIGTIFVTQSKFNGNLDTLNGADSKCMQQAWNAVLPGTWIALLSNSVHLKDRITHNGPFYRIDGVLIANYKYELFQGGLHNPVNINQYGQITNGRVWSGSDSAGTRWTEKTCLSWYSDSSSYWAAGGDSTKKDAAWLSTSPGLACNTNNHLYCLRIN